MQKVQVYVTDSIKSTLIAEEGGKKVEKSIGKSDLHIQRLDNGDLRIYLTTDEDSRDLAIASKLPRELMAALLGYDTRKVDATVFNIAASILQAKRSHVHRILELNGVPDLNLPCLVGENYLAAEVEAENRKMAILPNSPGRSSQSSLTLQDTYDKDAYLDVLVHVVEAARAHQFPTKSGESDLSQALNGLNISNSKPKPKQLKFSHSNTDEWKQMVGAAGELFVSGKCCFLLAFYLELIILFLLRFSRYSPTLIPLSPSLDAPIGRALSEDSSLTIQPTLIWMRGLERKMAISSTKIHRTP